MAMKEHTLISVIITNRNGASIIEKTLNLLFENIMAYRNDIEVIIVDDNSTDDSVAVIINLLNKVNKELRPRIKLIVLNKRVGPARARNIGFLASRGRYVVFMDNDTFSYNDWISECINVLESNSKIAIVQPLILPKTPSSKSWGGGGYITPSFYGFISKRCADEPFYALGSALVTRRDIFQLIGGFSEYLEYGHEEVDLAWKIRLLGFSVKCIDKAYVRHLGRLSASWKTRILKQRNRILIAIKNLQSINAIVFTLMIIIKILYTESLLIAIKSILDFLRTLPSTIRDRIRLKSLRRKTDKEIFSSFTNIILMELLKARLYGIIPYALTLAIYKLSSLRKLLDSSRHKPFSSEN